MNTYTNKGIVYKLPQVALISAAKLGVSEIAGRTCYDSFDKSEHPWVQEYTFGKDIEDMEESSLLHQLSHVYQHESVLEHISLSFHIKDISRGVLQELARHRIGSYSVRSTRYTLGPLVNLLLARHLYSDKFTLDASNEAMEKIIKENLVVTNRLATAFSHSIIHAFDSVYGHTPEEEIANMVSNDMKAYFADPASSYSAEDIMKLKPKKNAGDNFKAALNESWTTELVMTMNIRALKNFFKLRDSGAAWFQMQKLAQEMKKVISKEYMDLIVKG